MKKQDRRYGGSLRLLAFALMLVVSVVLVYGASVWYNAARADRMTPAEDVVVPVSVVRVMNISSQEKEVYHVESAAQTEDAEGKLTGYVVVTTVRGYKSDIRVQTTFSEDGETIAGIQVLSQDETEYVGTRVQMPEFTSLFTGRLAPIKLWGTATPGSPIDSLTGATVSSGAVVDAVNYAYAFVKARI